MMLDFLTLAIVFTLYTNAAVVAIHRYGLPIIIGAAVPMLLLIPLGYKVLVQRQKLIATPVLYLMALLGIIQIFWSSFLQRIPTRR